ncbi:uncharacterized protein BDZ99DRAFT_399750, partial [Mytilinidion resinicola]
PSKPPISLYPRHEQTQSPLFGKLFAAELRIFIYEAVLGDLIRPMHIVPHDNGYFEGIDILYTANHFSLEGARGMLEMRSVVPTPQWHMIRHVHVSTLFLTPRPSWLRSGFPPENYNKWSDGCKALQELRGLRSIRFEFIGREDGPAEADVESLVSVLEPLKDIKAPSFEVEMNFPIPDPVQAILGDTNFTLRFQQRPCRKPHARF